MKQAKQQEIALMRYGAIAPMIAGIDERYPSKTAFYSEISEKGLMEPDGKLHHYSLATIEFCLFLLFEQLHPLVTWIISFLLFWLLHPSRLPVWPV